MLNHNLPLTGMESEFAAEHHALIYTFLRAFDLPEEDFYDVAVFGYLSAVRAYLAREELRRGSFRTIAYRAMNRCVRRSPEFWMRENHGISTESYREELHSQDLRDTVAEACETVLSFQALAGQLVEGRGDRALEVNADLVIEVLILDGDDRMLQVFRDIRQRPPDRAAVAGAKGVVFVAVAVEQKRRLRRAAAFDIQQAFGVGRDLHDIHREQHRRHAAGHDPQAEHTADKADDIAENAAAFFSGFAGAFAFTAGLGRFCVLGGQVPLLFGVYGDRLLLGS